MIADVVVGARSPWSGVIPAGAELTITDLGGNQAVDCLFYDAHDHCERYCAHATMAAQGNIFLTTGSVLRSAEGTPMLTVVADNCGRHTPSAAPAARSPTPCATDTTPSTSTPASRTFSWRARAGGSAKRIWSATSTGL